jgi:hypothetical protein
MLEYLDLFGRDFTLRVHNYEKFKSNTGGIFFLIYLIGIITYFTYGLYEYFDKSSYNVTRYEEDFNNNEVNLNNQDFFISILDNVRHQIKNKSLKIHVQYVSDEKKSKIRKRECDDKQRRLFRYKNISLDNIYCFDNKKNETITVDTSPRKLLRYTIDPVDDIINKTYINIVYPINYDKGNKYIEQIIGINRIDLDPATHINFQVYLEKNIFITDDEIFSGKNHTKTITNIKRVYAITTSRSDNKTALATIYIKQSNKVKVKYSRRKRIYTVILEMISMSTTLLANFNAIVGLINTNKAKKSIINNIYHVNSFQEDEKEIKFYKEQELNFIRKKKENLEIEDSKKDDLLSNDPKFLSRRENIKENFLSSDNIIEEEIERNQSLIKVKENEIIINDTSNTNIYEKEKEVNKNVSICVKENIENILKNYPTIKNLKDNTKKNYEVSDYSYFLFLFLTCRKKKLKQVSILSKIIDKEFAISMNIYNYIKKIKDFTVIENILFNSEEKTILDFISQPLLNVNNINEEKEKIISNENQDYLENLYNKYNYIEKKANKSEIERKLIDFFKKNYEKIEENGKF